MANDKARHLRNTATFAEQRLWTRLRDLKHDGFHFRRQVPIDQYIVDFACLRARLIVEVDGFQHWEGAGPQRDAVREAHLRWKGFDILRFSNGDVFGNIDGVMLLILDKIGLTHEPPAPAVAPTDGAAARLHQTASSCVIPPPLAPPHKGEGDSGAARRRRSRNIAMEDGANAPTVLQSTGDQPSHRSPALRGRTARRQGTSS